MSAIPIKQNQLFFKAANQPQNYLTVGAPNVYNKGAWHFLFSKISARIFLLDPISFIKLH